MRTNSEKPADGEPKKSNGEDCRFSPRALSLYEMAKHRATRMAEACQTDKNRTAGKLKKIRRRPISEGDNP